MRNAPINPTTAAAKQMLKDPKIKKEIQIIYNANANPYNPVMWQKVYDIFAPIVRSAIQTSGAARLNLGYGQVEAQANELLKQAVLKYDVNNPTGARPATFISSNIVGNLSKISRAGKMFSGTDKNEDMKVLVNKAENILVAQNKPVTPRNISSYLKKSGYDIKPGDVKKAMIFNVREFSGSQVVGEDTSNAGVMTYQEVMDSKQKTPAEMINEKNKMIHAYNKISSFKDKEFIRAILWQEGDKLGLGRPASFPSTKPKNFKELCGAYKMGWERGKRIYLDFLRSAGNL